MYVEKTDNNISLYKTFYILVTSYIFLYQIPCNPVHYHELTREIKKDIRKTQWNLHESKWINILVLNTQCNLDDAVRLEQLIISYILQFIRVSTIFHLHIV